jgi:predicted Zn-dependent peptidase
VPQEVYQHAFANGLTLLAERMEHVRSAAFYFLLPAGCAYDPPGQFGIAGVLADLLTRGAGKRDSRALTTALDNLGLDRRESVGVLHTRLWGATVATNLPAALEIYSDVLLRPHLPEDELDAVKALALQDLHGLEDEPRTKVMVELYKRHYPGPLGHDHRGEEAALERLTIDDVRAHYRRRFRPQGAILSVAGNVEWEPLRLQAERLFGGWEGAVEPLVVPHGRPARRGHVAKETEQTQIAVAYDSVPVSHPDYYLAMAAVEVLSGDMSSRLFTEIREKEGLCYSVGASYSAFKDRASVIGYAGSRPELAPRTLELMLREFGRLQDGVEPDEVERVRVSLKTSLIMQQESTSSRAAALASDWFHFGRVRSLEEIRSAIEGLTPEAVVGHVRRHPPGDYTIVTLGPKPLQGEA